MLNKTRKDVQASIETIFGEVTKKLEENYYDLQGISKKIGNKSKLQGIAPQPAVATQHIKFVIRQLRGNILQAFKLCL